MAKNKIENLQVGQFYEKEFIVTEDIGEKFAEISKDYNPIHLNKEIAEQSRFKQRIVHGMLFGSYISGIIGNEFPGEGSVYLNQELSFRKPIYYDASVIVRVEIEDINLEKKRLTLKTICTDKENQLLIDGRALVLLEN